MGIYKKNRWGFSYRIVVIPEASHLQDHWESSNIHFAKTDTQFDCLLDSETRDSEILIRQSRDSLTFPQHLSPNVLTSGRIFGSAIVEHTTMGTLSGL